MNDPLAPAGQSDKGMLDIQLKLWDFLAGQVRRYTGGDSSSVPTELAQQLLSSALFTLGISLDDDPSKLAWLLDADLGKALDERTKAVKRRVAAGKKLWQTACLGLPQIENASLHDTLRSIGEFFNRYDYYYFAHEIPCSIDYQLCHPVADALLGIDYINEYLHRIIIENELLNHFAPNRCTCLLEAYCPGYSGLPVNLYEPVAVNALGLALVGADIGSLHINALNLQRIDDLLRPLPKQQALDRLIAASVQVCDALGITGHMARRYLRRVARELYPRITATLYADALQGVFLQSAHR